MVETKKHSGSLEYIYIKNESASAKVALQGAHIFSYVRSGEDDLLWVSEVSDFEHKKAIRGGVPICWPWFGQDRSGEGRPQHGFARTSMFEFVSKDESDPYTTKITLKLKPSDETRKLWPYSFELMLHITVSDKLSMELSTTNLDERAFELTQALHTYFDVSDISNIQIKGLESKPYLDALSWDNKTQNGVITFAGEVDRVYQEVEGEISLIDNGKIISIKNDGSSSVVVWNPWIDKCRRMSAMKEDTYRGFVCIESANAFDDLILLKPGETHTLKAVIS